MIAENAVKCKIAAFFGPYRARLRNGRIDKTLDIEEQIRHICISWDGAE